MKRRIVSTGGSLAVTLPANVVSEFRLKKGEHVDVSVHPVSNAIIVRVVMKHFRKGK